MKRKVVITILAMTMLTQSIVTAQANHKHVWVDDIAGSNETINRYTCECGSAKDEVIESIHNPIITFDANGGYVEETQKEAYKGRIKWLPIPKRTSDYQWEGWFTEPIGGEKVDTTRVYDEDTVLYAQWTTTGIRTLSFSSDGGSYVKYITGKFGETISLDGYVPIKEGYIFKGWYADPQKKEKRVTEFTFTENGAVYAKWEANPNQMQPDRLTALETEYMREQIRKEVTKRLRAFIQMRLDRYFGNIQSTEGGPMGSPFSISWGTYYGE